MKIAIITAGGAGMFCGSCMQDNTLARSLRAAGADAVLIPTYTPIRVDEDNVSTRRVFMGGINVYLDSKLPGWRYLPGFMKRWLDRPAIVQFLSQFSSSTSAAELGGLTVDLLKGMAGPQQQEIDELVRFLADDLKPDVILFSNALLSGIVPELRRRWSGRLACLLQGDDIFLKDLKEPWRTEAMALIRQNASHFDVFLTHSRYYSRFMQNSLQLPAEKFREIPLTIEDRPDVACAGRPEDFPEHLVMTQGDEIRVGYFARICPEKGAFRFMDAAEKALPQRPALKMAMAGFLPKLHEAAFHKRLAEIQKKFGERLHWAGSPADRISKFRILGSFDWLCVPTEYEEPKGLYVLEAALLGIPSLLPAHGAFPERIEHLGQGRLFQPLCDDSLVDALLTLPPLRDAEQRCRLRDLCLAHNSAESTADQVLKALGSGST